MKLLFVGGTSFVGRHGVEAAVAAGHDVAVFHRGRTNPDLFPETEHVLGDRGTDLALLKGREWDAAIDVSAMRHHRLHACLAGGRSSRRHSHFGRTTAAGSGEDGVQARRTAVRSG